MIVLPVSYEQQYIFSINEELAGIPMGVSYSMEFLKSFTVEELRFAVETCAKAADIFNSRCILKDGYPHIEFLPYQKMDIPVFDFASEEEYQCFCSQVRTTKINNRDQLYYVFIFSVSGSFYQLHFLFNHVIIDGLSVLVLSEKIQDVLLNQHAEVKLYPYANYLEKLKDYCTSERYLSDKTFWEDRFTEISKCDYLYKELIDTDASLINSMVFETSRELKDLLLGYCNKNDMSPHALIVAVLARIISEETGFKRFYFEIPVLNRMGIQEKNCVGAYEVTFPYVFDFSQYHSDADVIQSVRMQSFEYYRHKNIDWMSNVYSESYEEKNKRYIPQVVFSYMCLTKKPSASLFVIHHHHMQADTVPITLYVMDYNNWQTMTFSYTYWKDYFTEEEVVAIHHDIEKRVLEAIGNSTVHSLEGCHV